MPRPKAADPLIAALIAKLPAPGQEFPSDRQKAWLQLMAMALATSYGGEAVSLEAQPPAAPPPQPQKFSKPQPVYPFIIDKEGYARNGKTMTRVMPSDIGAQTVTDLRGEMGDMRGIIWADNSTGVNGADLTVTVPM